jgi:predicted RNA-binding Zn-ribbon protein involved in translation (DUF1610 family)
VRPCQGELKVHLSTMIALLGPEVELADLQKRLRCPNCGTDRVEVRTSQPPTETPGTKDAEKPRRRMRRSKGGESTIGKSREPWVVFQCSKCGRRGEYRREHLIEEFGGNVTFPDLLEKFAHARGCGLALPDAGPYSAARMSGARCLIHYDIED